MLAVVYARVSSEDQARTGFSLASQVDAGRERARDAGATIVQVFADEGVPGDVLERPGLQAALTSVCQQHGALFICHDPDRLARSLSLQLIVTDQIERAGARLDFINFEYRNTPEGQLFYSLRGAIAQFEKAKIRERTMRGKRQKAKAGGLTHNPSTFGYRFDPTTDTLHVHKAEADVVQQIYRWFLAGEMGPSSIARWLTQLGIAPARGGPAWHHASIRNILRNRSYTGTMHLQKWDYTDTRTNKYRPAGSKVPRRIRPEGEWIPHTIPVVIDEATFARAQVMLGAVRRRWSGPHKGVYLLNGLATCEICGRPIAGASRQSGTQRIRYYVCRGYAPGTAGEPRCAFGRLRAEWMEQALWNEVAARLGHMDLFPTAPPDDHSFTAERLATLQAEHERTVRLIASGVVDATVGARLLADQRDRLTALQRAMDGARIARPTDTAKPRSAAAVLGSMSDRHRQQVLRQVVTAVTLSRESITVYSPVLQPISAAAGADRLPPQGVRTACSMRGSRRQ